MHFLRFHQLIRSSFVCLFVYFAFVMRVSANCVDVCHLTCAIGPLWLWYVPFYFVCLLVWIYFNFVFFLFLSLFSFSFFYFFLSLVRIRKAYITWHFSLMLPLELSPPPPSCEIPPLAMSFFFGFVFLFFLPSNCNETVRVFSMLSSSCGRKMEKFKDQV